MWSLCKKDFSQFFSSLTGYIAIVLFLLVCGIFLFVLKDSNVFDYGYATADKLFELAPWVLVFLVPAIGMKLFSEELKAGTFEILRTKPLGDWQIVLGKYFSILMVLLIVIMPTFIYIASIKSLSTSGSIDGGGILGSYIGLYLLGAVFAAISLCCSSFSGNAVVAFLVSVFACLLLYYGFSAISKIPVFSGNADYYIEMMGIDFHYKSISRGVLDSRDIVYFASIILLFLFITVRNIRNK